VNVNAHGIGFVNQCSDIWTLMNIVSKYGKNILVFHSAKQHIEIPEKRKSTFICSWAQVMLKKKPASSIPKPVYNWDLVRGTLHTIGDKTPYHAGQKLLKNMANPLLKITNITPITSPITSPIANPIEYYLFLGSLLKQEITMNTSPRCMTLINDITSGYGYQSICWYGCQVMQTDYSTKKTQTIFYGVAKNGTIVKETSVSKFFSLEPIDFSYLCQNYWNESKNNYVFTQTDLLFDFDSTKYCIEVGDKTLDSTQVTKCIKNQQTCFIDGQFLVSLIGDKPCSMRIIGNNLSFVTHPLQLQPIQVVTGHIFTLSQMKLGSSINDNVPTLSDILVDRTKLSQSIMDDVKTGTMYQLDGVPKFIEMMDADSVFINPILALFRSTMSTAQRMNITKVKAYFVYSPLVRNQFLNACEMLLLDGVLIKPELVFHGIRNNSEMVANEICKFGFKCDLNSNGTVYGGGGTYGAKQASYSLDGYSEFNAMENKFRNVMFVALVVPGTSVPGKPGKLMGRKEHSFFGNTCNGQVLCCKDDLMIPIMKIEY
jgi:hypothetical protein